MSNEIKVGDKVRVSKDAPRVYLRGWGGEVEYNVYAIDGEAAMVTYGYQEVAIPTKYLIKVGGEKKEPKTPNVGAIKIPIEAEISDTFWIAYETNLAKEIAVKLAGSTNFRDAKEKAAYVVQYATEIVETLKSKLQCE